MSRPLPAIDLKHAFGLEPESAVAYFRSKGYAVSERWRDVWQEAHVKAFTVAGVARQDVLVDIRKSLDQALAKGETFATWRDNVDRALEGKGWIGRAGVDKQGEFHGGKLAPHRLETIFRTNMQSAYMAGRYEAMKANAADRPYWQYVAILDGRTRPAHRALNGRTFRHDDAFWNAFYPPNGFNCRCRARALAPDQVGTGPGQSPLSSSEGKLDSVWITPFKGSKQKVRTARFEVLPGQRVTPDPGWSYNPGASWQRPFFPGPDLERPATGLLSHAAPPLPTPEKVSASVLMPKGLPPEQYAQRFLQEFGARIGEPAVFVNKAHTPYVISEALFQDQAGAWKIFKDGREQHVPLLARALKEPDEIWQIWEKRADMADAWQLRQRSIKLFEIEGAPGGAEAQIGLAIFEIGPEGWRGVTSFMPYSVRTPEARLRYLEKLRGEWLVYLKGRK
jgi:SPP1 gp7 family putative phage head morphogenesis protein